MLNAENWLTAKGFRKAVRNEVRRISNLPDGHIDSSKNIYHKEGPAPCSVDSIRTVVTKDGSDYPTAELFTYPDHDIANGPYGTYKLFTGSTGRRQMEIFVQDWGQEGTRCFVDIKDGKFNRFVDDPSLLRRFALTRRMQANRP